MRWQALGQFVPQPVQQQQPPQPLLPPFTAQMQPQPGGPQPQQPQQMPMQPQPSNSMPLPVPQSPTQQQSFMQQSFMQQSSMQQGSVQQQGHNGSSWSLGSQGSLSAAATTYNPTPDNSAHGGTAFAPPPAVTHGLMQTAQQELAAWQPQVQWYWQLADPDWQLGAVTV